MDWLSQNWIWLALIAGVMWLLSRGRRGGMMGGCSAHGMAHEGPAGASKTPGADDTHPAGREEKAGQPAQRSPSSDQRGRGGCC